MFRLLMLCCALAHAQSIPPVLVQIRQKTLNDLRRAPNYMCSERIEHTAKAPGAQSFESLDRARVEFSSVDGKDTISWAGGDSLSPEELSRLVLGTVSNNDFAMHARVLLTNGRIQFSNPVEDKIGEQRCLRIDIQVPAAASDWLLNAGGRDTQVAYHGSVWVTPDTPRLVRIDMTTDSLPPILGYTTVTKKLYYDEVRIGEAPALLPVRSELSTVATNGEETRNEVQFSEFRPWSAPARPEPDDPGLPDEINVGLSLEVTVDSDTATIGDPVTARLEQTIKRKKETVVPKGAVLHGRISRMDLVEGFRIVDFTFTHFDTDGKRVDIRNRSNMLELEDRYTRGDKVLENPKMGPMSGRNVHTVFTRMSGPIQLSTGRGKVPRGFKLYLRSNRIAGT